MQHGWLDITPQSIPWLHFPMPLRLSHQRMQRSSFPPQTKHFSPQGLAPFALWIESVSFIKWMFMSTILSSLPRATAMINQPCKDSFFMQLMRFSGTMTRAKPLAKILSPSKNSNAEMHAGRQSTKSWDGCWIPWLAQSPCQREFLTKYSSTSVSFCARKIVPPCENRIIFSGACATFPQSFPAGWDIFPIYRRRFRNVGNKWR
mmetsp:Transcript_51889/g.155723  ORF Transcript_51889/g.155723 Transcript_51889/m.155723 type:complete len:204 (+) Transcript_51889:1102-1713(+)